MKTNNRCSNWNTAKQNNNTNES